MSHILSFFSAIILFLILSSCKEFYDEEFLDGPIIVSSSRNVNYSANLQSTDVTLTNMNGEAKVQVDADDVKVSIELDGIPQNIIQLHYTYTESPCDTFNISLPSELGTTRTYTITENLSGAAFDLDVESSGSGDNNLEGKSFVIRAFSNLIDSTSTTTPFVIACGQLQVDVDDGAPEDATSDDTPI